MELVLIHIFGADRNERRVSFLLEWMHVPREEEGGMEAPIEAEPRRLGSNEIEATNSYGIARRRLLTEMGRMMGIEPTAS